MVAVTLGKDGVDVDFNIISSIFGKGENNIVDWLDKGYARYINKEKALDYLHHSDRNISEALRNPKLVSAAKIVENFENPKIEGENSDEEIDSIGADRLLGENLADIIAHQFGCRHLEFIAEISPESEEEFVVETVMVVKTHSGIGLTETAASHLIGAAAIERHHISMERNIAMIEEERRHQGKRSSS